jgi:hypothetical protein
MRHLVSVIAALLLAAYLELNTEMMDERFGDC